MEGVSNIKIKIDDIAKLTGYSKSTVSKVINNYSGISEEARKKIQKVIKEQNFEPNIQARNLAGKKDIVIGVFIFDRNGISGPFFQEIISLLAEKADEKEIKILLSVVKNREQKLKIKQLIDNGTIYGGIIIGVTLFEPELDELINEGYKFVVFDYKTSVISKNTFLINSNNYKGGEMVANYFLNKGLKNLYHISGDDNKLASIEREEGFLDIIEGKGVACKILKGDFQMKKAKKLIMSEIKNGNNIPDGIFCANDEMAIGCIEALLKLNINLKDITIVGFDNTLISRLYYPKISTISYDLEKMAEKAIEIMLKLVNNEKFIEKEYKGELKLHIRET